MTAQTDFITAIADLIAEAVAAERERAERWKTLAVYFYDDDPNGAMAMICEHDDLREELTGAARGPEPAEVPPERGTLAAIIAKAEARGAEQYRMKVAEILRYGRKITSASVPPLDLPPLPYGPFKDTNPEGRWTEDMDDICPCCGGSGHRADAEGNRPGAYASEDADFEATLWSLENEGDSDG